ncbi:MAG TPA: CocE/NonD family hydrolase [Thermoanaerobaculia bacterium]|nr:CocE/NonD family hydrolase [Thermoanaerobaculia bacterium]
MFLPLLWTSILVAPLSAQELDLPAETGDEAALAQAMPVLAEQVIAVYQEADRDRYLENLFRLQWVAGRNEEAIASIRELRALRQGGVSKYPPLLFAQYEVLASARMKQASGGLSLDEAFRQAFLEVFARLDDKTANRTLFPFGTNLDRLRADWLKKVEEHKGRRRIPLADAITLIRSFQVQQVYQIIAPRVAGAAGEDEARRYVIDRNVLIRTPDGAQLAAIVVRPRSATAPQPALLGFTIYANDDWSLADAKNAAAYGYVGVVAYTRGKGRSPDKVVPYQQYEGDDARTIIQWIARQPWCDGRVGMYGGSYNGYLTWAAAKKLPRELKALMTSATAAPGIDVPMQGNVFMNFVYPWIPYVTNTKGLDDESYGDTARWDSLNRNWYKSGRAYRDLDKIDGHPNPIHRSWLDHPGYDGFWRRLIPYKEEFAAIKIPVLQTTGYFDGAQVGVLYYFQEHTRYNPRADHTLVIGPYEHFTMQRGVAPVVQGYSIDPVANLDLQELRMQWFDFILKGGEKPALLRDRVNYQVLGANEWKHAPTLEAMANGALRLYLSPARVLSREKPETGAFVDQTVDFADRSDADHTPALSSVTQALDTHSGIAFVSDVLTEPTEVSGLFSGKLDFLVNKKDFDVTVTLYEQMPSGDYLQLAAYMGRASHARDRSRRQLLMPGKRQALEFRSERIVSRKAQAGSRLIVVLGINKQPDLQINYGTGKEVSDETILDARIPLQIRWYGDSFVDLPVWR